MCAIWKKNELKLKDWNGDLPAARWGLLAQSSSIKGATLRVRTVRGQEMTISKIDNRLLWTCIFGTFKKVSWYLWFSFYLSFFLSLSLLFFLSHSRSRTSNSLSRRWHSYTSASTHIARFFYALSLFHLYVFLSRIFYFYLFFTLSIPYIICLILYTSKHVCPFSV